MWQQIFAYIKYLFLSKSKYGIHSPFVYDFITKALEVPQPLANINNFNSFRNDILADTSVIQVTDFGSGSKVFNSNKRKISAIAKHAGINKKKAKLLQKIACYFKPNKILELGTSLGISTAAMSIAAPYSKIISLEGCPKTAAKANVYFKKHQLQNITIKVGEFSTTLPKVYHKNTFDIIYFDGNHQKEATLNYFENCLQSIHNNTLCIFDDIHWSKGMEEAWDMIKNHPKTKISIDLYDIGLIFFRKEQVKQHFVLKF